MELFRRHSYAAETREGVLDHHVHMLFFDYFSAVPWIARLPGIPLVIYEMQARDAVVRRKMRVSPGGRARAETLHGGSCRAEHCSGR
jgi:hypothetical protein